MGRRPAARASSITYPSRVEGWLDVCEVEGLSQLKNRNLPWSPLYCVLQQDEQTFTAYCSEEISIFPATPNKELTDILFTEFPRVRLDRVRRPIKPLWDAPPTVTEEPEDSDGYQMDIALNTTLNSDLVHIWNDLRWCSCRVYVQCVAAHVRGCNPVNFKCIVWIRNLKTTSRIIDKTTKRAL
ncbi:unnamed protein product [Hermetia illucens]|uniref:Uncharacterized protein n=1 Tax=Hermetia illucens TaxID=343691 RepID=A0A7R8YVM6_HERIL|nr:unnamed protein product [Hermetia illucens]